MPPKSKPDNATAALYDHCNSVYNAMLEEAKTVYSAEDDLTIVMWEGMLVRLITGRLHLSVPYYSSTISALKRMECIRQIKRGGGTAPSQWEILRAPTLEAFETAVPPRILAQGKYAQLQDIVDRQEKRIARLETIFEKFFNEELEASKNEETDPEQEG